MGEINKARYWVAICYPENMKEDWQECIGDLIEYPYCYCIHDKDHLGSYKPKRKKDDERQRKVHVHIFIAFPNTTTLRHAWDVFDKLSDKNTKDGCSCAARPEAVVNPESKYKYLIHDTETAKKQGKYLYPKSERIEGNNFDIGAYIQLTTKAVRDMKRNLGDYIISASITNFADLYIDVSMNFDDDYFEVLTTHASFFEKIVRGNYQKFLMKMKKNS